MEQGLVTRGGKASGRPMAAATGLSRRGWRRRSRVCSRRVDFVGVSGPMEAALGRLERLAGRLGASPTPSALTGSLSHRHA